MRNAKRLSAALLLAAALILSSASCGGQTETASEAPAAASSEPQRDYTVQISKDTLRRTGLDITAAAHRLGLTNVTTNDDGSCTVEMTKGERDAVCAALKESLHEQIIALPEDGTWPFIKSVTLSEDGRSAEILSTKDLYKPERDNAAAQAVYIPALLYAAITPPQSRPLPKVMQAEQKAPPPHPTPQNKPHTKNGAAQVYHPCAAPFFLLFRLCKLAHFFVF